MTKPSPTLRVRHVWAVLAVVATAALVAGCSTGPSKPGPTRTITQVAATPTGTPASPTSSRTTPKPTPTTSAAVGAPVHIKTELGDGAQVGIGMPIIAYFSRKITSGKTLQQDTTVTADGRPVVGAWYFEYSGAHPGYPIEGHWRPERYWPAHTHIHVNLPMKGQSAGAGLVYNDSLTLDFSIGAANIATVVDSTHTMTLVSDGKVWGTFPVSLGEHDRADMRTFRGTKVIMEQVPTVCMHDTNNTYYECGIKWDQRLTYTGEYLHAAPWNCDQTSKGCDSNGANHIGHLDSSNGCTNLLPTDAVRLYNFLEVGDVVRYPDADGPLMQLGQGYGDWNVTWPQWLTGGLVPTT